MRTLAAIAASFLAGYGLASYAATHREMRELLTPAEVERRTRPAEPNVVPLSRAERERLDWWLHVNPDEAGA